jgi:hypothetical protein
VNMAVNRLFRSIAFDLLHVARLDALGEPAHCRSVVTNVSAAAWVPVAPPPPGPPAIDSHRGVLDAYRP